MKIKNDLIRIKSKNKTYDFQNMIMDEYLKRFANAQINEQDANKIYLSKKLNYCLLKFDTPFENITESSIIHNQDFDICLLTNDNYNQLLSQKQITITYQYSNIDMVFDYAQGTAVSDLTSYYGRKITAIGFNSWWINDENAVISCPVCAILDTSNYEIYFNKDTDFAVTRRDIIVSDADFYSNSSLVKGPAHLAPCGTPQIIDQPSIYNSNHTAWQSFYDNGYGILYSIGLSNYKDYIAEEFIVGTDLRLQVNNNEITISGLDNILQTNNLLYSDNNLYPSSNLYPVKKNYKYLIFKYKVWQNVHSGTYDNVINTITDTGVYYYQAIPIENFGDLNLKIKYERG